MADSRMKDRVKGLFAATAADSMPPDGMQVPVQPDSDAQRQALQVLVLAQRTADEHVATAQRQADGIRADARATAEQIVRHAQAQADAARREAGKALAEARAKAEQVVREAQAHADAVRHEAEKVLLDARAEAEDIAGEARRNADALDHEAQQRYQEAVGGLAAQRAALQQEIEGLRRFDRDYRSRLRAFMRTQLDALGDEDPPPPPVQADPPEYAVAAPAEVAADR